MAPPIEMEELSLLKGGVQRAISRTGRRHFAQIGLALLSVCVVKSVVLAAIGSQPADALLGHAAAAAHSQKSSLVGAAHSQKLSLVGRGMGPRDGSTGFVEELPGGVFDAMDDSHAQAKLPKVNLDSWSGNTPYHGVSVFKTKVHQLRHVVHPLHDGVDLGRVARVEERGAVSEPLQPVKAEDDGPAGVVEDAAKEGLLPPPGDDSPAEEDTAMDGVLARTSEDSSNAAGSLADTANDQGNAEGALAETAAAQTEDVPADDDPSGEKAEYPGANQSLEIFPDAPPA